MFAKPVGFVARELLILAKNIGFVARSCLETCGFCLACSQKVWKLSQDNLAKPLLQRGDLSESCRWSTRTATFIARWFHEGGRETSCLLANNSAGFARFCCEVYLFAILVFLKFAFGFERPEP